MNYWTKLSIELANQRDYLDQLFKVYPMAPETVRELDPTLWHKVETAFNAKNNEELIKNLFGLNLFPIKDSYVPYLRRDRKAATRNPQTVNRLAGRLYEMGLDTIWARCSEPKETNRQIGPLFRRWLLQGSLGIKAFDKVEDFTGSDKNAILTAGDAVLKQFAHANLGYKSEKGLDFVARVNKKYVIGEAKFISDFGGHQDRQFDDAMFLASNNNINAITVAILDGVVYIPGKHRMYRSISRDPDINVMSSLMLRDFLYQI